MIERELSIHVPHKCFCLHSSFQYIYMLLLYSPLYFYGIDVVREILACLVTIQTQVIPASQPDSEPNLVIQN